MTTSARDQLFKQKASPGRWHLVRAALGLTAAALLVAGQQATPAFAEPVPAGSPVPVVSPRPQQIEATGGRPVVITGKKVRVVVGDVDAATRDLVLDVVRNAGADKIELVSPTDPVKGKAPLTVHVGALSAPGIAQELAAMAVTPPAELPAEGYVLAVKSNPHASVVLGGVDGDGTYYAAQTLRQLVYAHDGAFRIPGVQIVDYPSMPLRGSIEGFYGAPWSHEDRLDQMRFYGEVKMNTYIYAPKDDPYHRDQWRTPYPADELAQLSELVNEATANHVRFTFALSPGFHQTGVATKICFTSPSDWAALTAKLQAMYDIGVRAISIPFDDIALNTWSCASDQAAYGAANSQINQARAQADLLNRLQKEFLEAREDTYALQMVPTHYEGTGDTAYRQTLRAHLDPVIEVMWTGMETVPPHIRISDADDAATVFGRKVFVWDNYPVNDFGTPGRLHLAPYQKREAGLSDHIVGIVANPMNQSGASKVVLFTVADFLWNEYGYDHEESWTQAARYLADGDERAVAALLTFFDLNYFAPTFGANPWLPQAPKLAASIADFWGLWEAGERQAAIDGIRPHAVAIAEAADVIRAGVADPIFQADVERWLLASDLWGQAFLRSLDAAELRLKGDDAGADALVAEARALTIEATGIRTDPRPRPQGTLRLADGVLDVFLNPPPKVTVDAPSPAAGEYGAVPAAFGPPIPLNGITRDLVVVASSTGTPSQGCGPLVGFPAGAVAVVDRGGTNCNFVTKVTNAQNAGASAVIVVNNTASAPTAMTGSGPGVTIPSVMISLADGERIKDGLPASGRLASLPFSLQ
ncbi:MAG TPA: beta-N-acetylglucosaminidase domain-containing protein [Micromonosporaceae bacterium]|nr:beta-N-acetylglucosaminidase domain-containing protein [Micromonosporaceae bacterium]